MMEPNLHTGVEEQVSRRIHRIGTLADKCWVYRLLNPDSRIEEMVVLDQLHQLTSKSLAENVTECGVASSLDQIKWTMDEEEHIEEDEKDERQSLDM